MSDALALALATADDARLAGVAAEVGEPRYRVTQIRQAAWRRGATGFEAMTFLPAALRAHLAARLRFHVLTEVATRTADRDLTHKLLLRAPDGQTVETVAMTYPARPPAHPRRTVCVSTQVGCAVGCAFCATGQLGLRRHLTAAEITDQVLIAGRAWHAAGLPPPSHVVYMGMGEPLQNYQPTLDSVRALIRWGVAARRITISTSGVVPAIDRLATERLPLRLAISLHAVDDELRTRLVPLNGRYPLADCLAAGARYAAASGRRLSLEYVLIAGVNDRPEDARGLRRLAEQTGAHVNLIPMNRIPGSAFTAPSPLEVRRFAVAVGGRASVRFSRGDRAAAACGQLRAELAPRPAQLARTARRLRLPVG
ncbi:MAG TPA: 23S rRNA (adenine(2503)-C(2))-methyltransferase RlmN [Candidatus Dormibacteraeota bacterium]|nr:23S rRNA (adenine(2503)-C(2))-methyltransferase RlmN [Candidatus Dormibacteraeota bacterium]